MWSVKSALPFVISALTFAASAVQAEAKIIQYEINGQVYCTTLRAEPKLKRHGCASTPQIEPTSFENRRELNERRTSSLGFSAPPRRQRLLRPKPSFSAFLQCPQLPRSGSGLFMPRSPLLQDLGRQRELRRASGPRLSRLRRRDGLPLRGS